ncbi:MAG: hypothetical protein HUK26_08700, partial [Duodenibacillus sp.]|nr:hypothetical protein [Duodenibacillus sp.]
MAARLFKEPELRREVCLRIINRDLSRGREAMEKTHEARLKELAAALSALPAPMHKEKYEASVPIPEELRAPGRLAVKGWEGSGLVFVVEGGMVKAMGTPKDCCLELSVALEYSCGCDDRLLAFAGLPGAPELRRPFVMSERAVINVLRNPRDLWKDFPTDTSIPYY